MQWQVAHLLVVKEAIAIAVNSNDQRCNHGLHLHVVVGEQVHANRVGARRVRIDGGEQVSIVCDLPPWLRGRAEEG